MQYCLWPSSLPLLLQLSSTESLQRFVFDSPKHKASGVNCHASDSVRIQISSQLCVSSPSDSPSPWASRSGAGHSGPPARTLEAFLFAFFNSDLSDYFTSISPFIFYSHLSAWNRPSTSFAPNPCQSSPSAVSIAFSNSAASPSLPTLTALPLAYISSHAFGCASSFD